MCIYFASYIDRDECAGDPPPCDQICIDLPGSYHCACLPHYHLASDNVTCLQNMIGKKYIVPPNPSMHHFVNNEMITIAKIICNHRIEYFFQMKTLLLEIQLRMQQALNPVGTVM